MLDETPKTRRRKSQGSEAEEGRRQMDARLAETWERLFAFQGEQVAELVRTVRGFNGTPGLMERMTRMETVMAQLATSLAEQKAVLSEMHGVLQGLASVKTVAAAEPVEPKNPEEAQVVTKGGLALMTVDFGKTIVTAVVVWALLTLGPELMAHLWAP